MSRRTTRRDDDGSASVWAVGITALLLVALLLITFVVDVLAARSRAAAAADLAALAGAPAASVSSPAACGSAVAVAAANGATLTSCRAAEDAIDVRATVTLHDPWRSWLALLAGTDSVTSGSRAGMR
jgi:secretion/DNA translocation related TadE-like protein